MVSAEALARATQIIDGLSDEELERLERGEIVPDEVAFVEQLQIEDKVTGGLIPFILWNCQLELLGLLASEQRLFVLKARQLGITWTVLAHLLYLATYWGDRLILIASQTGDDAAATLQRLRRLHASIPAGLHPQRLVKDNTTRIEFANHSRFEVVKATRRAGRSKAAFATLLDELAFLDWPPAQLSALDAASERLYAVTTGNGPGDLAHSIWRQAQEGTGRWRAVFYPWSAHPGRVTDPDWYRANVEEAPEPRLAQREYAATPEQAFAAPQGCFFERWNAAVNAPCRMPAQHNWETWRAVDFGYHWPACLWMQISPAGQYIVVAALARREPYNWTTEEFADKILAVDAALNLVEPPRATFCDSAGTQRAGADRRVGVRDLQAQGPGAGRHPLLDSRRLRAHHGRDRRPRPAAAGLALAYLGGGGARRCLARSQAARCLRRELGLHARAGRAEVLLCQPVGRPGHLDLAQLGRHARRAEQVLAVPARDKGGTPELAAKIKPTIRDRPTAPPPEKA